MRIKRRINHTGRKKIDRARIDITFTENENGPPSFDADINLDGLSLPDDAHVFIEAYYKLSVQRFDFGTVAKRKAKIERRIGQVDTGGGILFRVKVVSADSKSGRLLAAAERVPATDTEEEPSKDHLVSVKAKDIGHEVWRMDLSPDLRPVLIINNNIPNAIGQMKTSPLFQGLILPAVIRETLTYLFWDEAGHFDEDSWQGKWMAYCEQLTGLDGPEDEHPEDIRRWIDDVVMEFGSRFKLVPRVAEQLLGDMR